MGIDTGTRLWLNGGIGRQEELEMPRTAKYDATERQISFIVTLAVERGFVYSDSDKTLAKDPTTVELTKLTKRGASSLIAWLKDQPKQVVAPKIRYATESQVNYLVKLADRAGWEVE